MSNVPHIIMLTSQIPDVTHLKVTITTNIPTNIPLWGSEVPQSPVLFSPSVHVEHINKLQLKAVYLTLKFCLPVLSHRHVLRNSFARMSQLKSTEIGIWTWYPIYR